MIKVGIDLGYFGVKATTGDHLVTFPSAIGELQEHIYAHSNHDGIKFEQPARFVAGENAVHYSRTDEQHREDRNWIESDEYYYLFLAAVSELVTDTDAHLDLVVGLPVAYYKDADKVIVRQQLEGSHTIKRCHRDTQTLTVTRVRVVPQPIGTLADVCLDNQGNVANKQLAMSHVGIIDIGGKTTNLLHAYKLKDVPGEVTSIATGGWKAIDYLRGILESRYKNMELRDYEIADILKTRSFVHDGQDVDFEQEVKDACNLLFPDIQKAISRKWKSPGKMRKIILTGGGSLLVGDAFNTAFPQLMKAANPVTSNVRGYLKLAQRG